MGIRRGLSGKAEDGRLLPTMGRDPAVRAICLLFALVLGAEPVFAQGGNTAAAEA